ncbi:hypothetical protein I9W82_001265 [Candida metapsilosis]|uniref:Uncharacterized protein n=1 Tax=Candida metapsilosis TaxID=273372 RepID=A0A8H7ZI23_9ASCO|nr:hypothetical protein I9W82_001265 [Candida metapsilosis]
MRFSKTVATSLAFLSSAVVSQDVACLVDGQSVAVVDLDTGVCPFTIPAGLPAPVFTYTADDDYTALFYYSLVDATKYFTDIVNAGNVISIPARLLYGTAGAPLYQVSAQEEPASNSTGAIRKRLMKGSGIEPVAINKRDAQSVADSLKSRDGTFIGNSAFEVVDVADVSSSSSSASGAGSATGVETIRSTTVITETVDCSTTTGTTTLPNGETSTFTSSSPILSTVTADVTSVITITSCHEDLCHKTTVAATLSAGTKTVSGIETVYTTYCPLSSVETPESTKIITTTDHEGKPTTVTAVPVLTTETVGGTVTEYVTYCPLSTSAGGASPATSTPVATTTYTSGGSTVTSTIYGSGEKPSGAAPSSKPVATTTYTSGGSVVTSVVYQTVAGSSSAGSSSAAPSSVAATTVAGQSSAAATTVAGESSAAATTVAGESSAAATTVAGESSAAPTTVAAQSSTPAAEESTSAAVSTYEAAAVSNGATYLALALVPLAYFI